MENYVVTLWYNDDTVMMDGLDMKTALATCENCPFVALVTIENPEKHTFTSYSRSDFIDAFIEEV